MSGIVLLIRVKTDLSLTLDQAIYIFTKYHSNRLNCTYLFVGTVTIIEKLR